MSTIKKFGRNKGIIAMVFSYQAKQRQAQKNPPFQVLGPGVPQLI
jgi:hypothetical protein